jgi:S-DNA-T family DNA segregation ATPase FtsK/SpoIIIE
VVLTLLRGDPLVKTIPALPVTAVPDFTALPVAVQEDGQLYGLRLFGTQALIVGATGSGKGSLIWAIVRALAGGVGTGLV